MSYDFEVRFQGKTRQVLIEAVKACDPSLELSTWQPGSATIDKNMSCGQRIIERTLMLLVNCWLGVSTEMTSPSLGIQIAFFRSSAGLSVSFTEIPSTAKLAFDQAWRYPEVMQRTANLTVIDGQVGSVINLQSDYEMCYREYQHWLKQVSEIAKWQ